MISYCSCMKFMIEIDRFCAIILIERGCGGMADALDSGSSGGNTVEVQVLSSAYRKGAYTLGTFFVHKKTARILIQTALTTKLSN
jgi:hypothetical protein